MQRNYTSLALGQALDGGPDRGHLDAGEHDLLGPAAGSTSTPGPSSRGTASSDTVAGRRRRVLRLVAVRTSRKSQAGNAAGSSEAGDVAKGQDERFLGDVGGLVQIAAQPDGGGDRDVLESVDELGPGPGIASLGGPDQRRPTVPILEQCHH